MAKGHLKKFQWATRSFTVPSHVVPNFISNFVLTNKSVCDEMQTRAEKNGFVLYNAYCTGGYLREKHHHVEHYFTND